jgi:hypothetical protein
MGDLYGSWVYKELLAENGVSGSGGRRLILGMSSDFRTTMMGGGGHFLAADLGLNQDRLLWCF